MTEAEWSTSTDPQAMLDWLRHQGKLSERKSRLFACACCRSLWHLLPQASGRAGVEVAEGFADSRFTLHELTQAYAKADAAYSSMGHTGSREAKLEATALVLHAAAYTTSSPAAYTRFDDGVTEVYDSMYNAFMASDCTARAAAWAGRLGEDLRASRLLQSSLLRDIVANPFRPPPPIAPSLLTWNDRLIRRLAEEAYNHRNLPAGTLDPDRLAVLADALQEAGCDDVDILGHLRRPEAVHVRGCWCLDHLLNKG